MRPVVLAVGFCFIAGALEAQGSGGEAAARRGVWLSLGAGLGSHGVGCDDCVGAGREQGLTTSFQLGAALSPRVTLGADLVAWVKPLNEPGRGEYAFFGALMGELQVYPVPRKGLFLLGGGGYIVDVVNDDLVLDTPGIVLGIGYDIRTGRRLSLTPQLKYLRTVDGGNLTSSLYQFGISATWR
jgi:hypothetical protein